MKNKWVLSSLLALSIPVTGLMVTPKAHAAVIQEGPGMVEQQGWDAPPHEFSEIQRRGFHDGVEGARKDFDKHRAPNVEDRDEYRHPHVDHSARDDYREGFRHGYDAAMNHLEGR
jgi:hypothetical protein